MENRGRALPAQSLAFHRLQKTHPRPLRLSTMWTTGPFLRRRSPAVSWASPPTIPRGRRAGRAASDRKALPPPMAAA
jgi:hypothetical protein